MQRSILLLAALVATVLLVGTGVTAMRVTEEEFSDLMVDPEISSFLEQQSQSDAAFESELTAELGDAPTIVVDRSALPKKKGHGFIQRGGKKPKSEQVLDLSQGTADGSVLPPWDMFGMHAHQERKLAWRQKRRQAQVDRETQLEVCKSMRERAARRIANEKREAEEAKAEAIREAARLKKKNNVETELLEIQTNTEAEAEAELEAALAVDSEASLEAEAAADQAAELAAEQEADADAAESAQDLAEMESDVEDGCEADVDIESQAEDASLMETSVAPSSQVTFGREDLVDEQFDNAGGRGVFKRRARGREITRFEKQTTSSGGQAVVNGVTRTPCGKEITDKGLFGAVVLSNPGPTVEAVDPQAPTLEDQNLPVIKALPVVPQYKEKHVADEYGDL